MLKRFWNWLTRKKETVLVYKKVRPEQVEHEDLLGREVIARAFNSGKMVIGTYDDDGNAHIREVED